MFKKLFSLFAALTLSVGLWAAAPANVESVDLGLPSGLKWATFNVGATTPEGYGDYFAWGETGTKTQYSAQSYTYKDNPTTLPLDHDAATANWGSDWRMPTMEELIELQTKCTWTMTQKNGIYGCEVKGSNGNTIFLPFSGYRSGSSLTDDGSDGYYWSSSLDESNGAYNFHFVSDYLGWDSGNRFQGHSVRPVTTKSIVPGPKVGDQFEDATSGLKFEVTSLDPKAVKVIANNYSNTSYEVPATASYLDETFAVTEIGEKAFFGCTALQSVTFLGNACQNAIGEDAFSGVGNPDPALLTLPDNWTGTLPDEDGKWYGGKFELSSIPGLTTYLDENGEEQEIVAAEVENASEAVTWGTAGNTTWYIVKGTDVQLSKGAVCAGDVRLILADGAKLTATGESWQSGIKVSGDGNSLTIYGQTAQSGQLIAKGGSSGAGIGGGYKQDGSNIIINGGIVTATGGGEASGIGGGSSYNSSTTIQGSNITINAGTVTATGGLYAAGIGGGNRGSGSNITINGGIVKATGANSGSGIGGGNQGHGSNITINGGTVEATGGSSGAGIGGGYKGGKGFDITINGGVVTANGGNHAAGIGGGNMGIGYNITISGGTVTAIGGTDIAGIGIGESATVAASNIYISDAYILKAGAEADPTAVIEHSSATDLASTLTQQYVQFGGLATPYTRTVTANSWGTVCLPYAVTGFSGVTFYKVNYYNASENALYVEEVSALEAGKPYIFEAEEDGTLTINHSATAPMAYSEAGNEGGLYGSFARTAIESDGDMAAISGGSVVIAGDGNTVTVPACRAYLDMNEVATSEQPHKAPLRAMGVPRQQPTNNENVNADGNMNGKFIINGQFVIVKDGKKINALGF